jgi:hypothetical protein
MGAVWSRQRRHAEVKRGLIELFGNKTYTRQWGPSKTMWFFLTSLLGVFIACEWRILPVVVLFLLWSSHAKEVLVVENKPDYNKNKIIFLGLRSQIYVGIWPFRYTKQDRFEPASNIATVLINEGLGACDVLYYLLIVTRGNSESGTKNGARSKAAGRRSIESDASDASTACTDGDIDAGVDGIGKRKGSKQSSSSSSSSSSNSSSENSSSTTNSTESNTAHRHLVPFNPPMRADILQGLWKDLRNDLDLHSPMERAVGEYLSASAGDKESGKSSSERGGGVLVKEIKESVVKDSIIQENVTVQKPGETTIPKESTKTRKPDQQTKKRKSSTAKN